VDKAWAALTGMAPTRAQHVGSSDVHEVTAAVTAVDAGTLQAAKEATALDSSQWRDLHQVCACARVRACVRVCVGGGLRGSQGLIM
jgi:hypothetical protein